jgi:hypothetical protein
VIGRVIVTLVVLFGIFAVMIGDQSTALACFGMVSAVCCIHLWEERR